MPDVLNVQKYNDINFGYACLNTQLRNRGIFCSRTARLDTLKKKENPVEYLKTLAHQNLKDLQTILQWNAENNVKLFRMSSDIFPFCTHKDYAYPLDDFKETLQRLGTFAKETGQRLTMHPGQFHQLSSQRENVVQDTIDSLTYHADILQCMGLDHHSILVIHGGNTQGGKEKALARFKENWKMLPEYTQRRIVLENCETCYTVQDLLGVCNELSVPLVLDYHHDDINPSPTPLKELIPQVLETWRVRGIRPKFHMSQSQPDVQPTDNIQKRRAHSDLITRLPNTDVFPDGIDLMLECKLKEQSIPIVEEVLKSRDL